jgi:hypothetical protein
MREIFNKFVEILRGTGQLTQQDVAQLYGHIEVSVFDAARGGKRIYHVKKRNQVVNSGRQAVLEMLTQYATGSPGQQNPEYNQIWSLGVGTDGTPPAVNQTNLGAEVLTKVFARPTEVLYVPDPTFEIHCSMTFATTEANDPSPLQEVGLFTRGNNDDPYVATNRLLYARQTFSPFVKTNTMTVVFNWILGMTVA